MLLHLRRWHLDPHRHIRALSLSRLPLSRPFSSESVQPEGEKQKPLEEQQPGAKKDPVPKENVVLKVDPQKAAIANDLFTKSVVFLGSFTDVGEVHKVVKLGLPEVAILGRSNAGKSSLIGALLGNPKMVKTSQHPVRRIGLFALVARPLPTSTSPPSPLPLGPHKSLEFLPSGPLFRVGGHAWVRLPVPAPVASLYPQVHKSQETVRISLADPHHQNGIS